MVFYRGIIEYIETAIGSLCLIGFLDHGPKLIMMKWTLLASSQYVFSIEQGSPVVYYNIIMVT